jgi:hypothetical protein
LFDQSDPTPQITYPILPQKLLFSGFKTLLSEDQIFTLPSSSAGGSFGKISSLLKTQKTPIIGVVPY